MEVDVMKKVPVREQEAKVRATNFEEVCYGYNVDEAMLEATRCLHCKNPRCVGACPVGIKIPEFIEKVGKAYEEKTGIKADFYIAEIGDGARRIS